MITYSNLDVFVLTHNRADYLRIMLKSLCNQTAEGFIIKILNNASDDHTEQVIHDIQRQYPSRKIVHIVHEKNIGSSANFKKSQELANNEYTAVFHDDDLIHPAYIETAMLLLLRHSNAVMLSCNPIVFSTFEPIPWIEIEKGYSLWEPEDTAFLSCLMRPHLFASMIYKTEAYQSAIYHSEKYGKLFDAPFLLEVGTKGTSIVMNGAGIQYRLHEGSDSNNISTGPFADEVLAVMASLQERIRNHNFIKPFLIYMKALKMYQWAKITNPSQSDFEKIGIEKGLFKSIHVKMMSHRVFRFLLKEWLRIIRYFYRIKTSCRNHESPL